MRSNGLSANHGGRDPVNELYDRGSDLVEAALVIRRVSAGSGVAPAVPALLACIECALDELCCAAGSLAEPRRPAAGEAAEPAAERLRRALARLETALSEAGELAGVARVLGSEAVGARA